MEIQSFTPYSAIVATQKDQVDILERIISFGHSLGPRKIDKPIVLYGAGSLGRLAKDFFNYLGLPVCGVVDIYADHQNTDSFWKKRNTEVLFPSQITEASKRHKLLICCIATAPLIALRKKLTKEGWTDVVFFYDVAQGFVDRHPLNNGWFMKELDQSDQQNVRLVFGRWNDEASRAHYLQFLAWRRMRVELLSDKFPVQGDNRYFIPEVVSLFRDDEVFVDCGAHLGSVVSTFLEYTNDKYTHLYAIEPDQNNFKKMTETLSGIGNLSMIEVALANENKLMSFSEGFDFASKLTTQGNALVEARKLDSLNLSPTFIKMHLEGGELDALKGGLQTIQQCRPILAVTVYHNDDGVTLTPLYLMENLQNYRFLFRNHSWAGTGAVIYAIPNER